MSENVTWLMVGLVAAAYITQRHIAAAKKEPTTVQLSANNEIDPTRWRHEGDQPPTYGTFDGNRISERSEPVLVLQNALAF